MHRVFSVKQKIYNKNDRSIFDEKPFFASVMIVALIVTAAYTGTGFSVFANATPIISAISIGVVALSLFAAVYLTRSVFAIMLTMLPSLLTLLLTGSMALAAIPCSFITAIGIGSYLLISSGSPILILAVPLSFGISFLASGNLYAPLISLAVFPAIYVFAASFDENSSRTSMITRITSVLTAETVIALLVLLFVKKGSIDADTMNATVNDMLNGIGNSLRELLGNMINEYKALGMDEAVLKTLDPFIDNIDTYIRTIFSISPAILIFMLNIVSFASHQLTLSLFDRTNKKKYINDNTVPFRLSTVSAVVFIIAYLTSFILSFTGETDIISLVCTNIYMILFPGMILTGIFVLLARDQYGRRHTFWLISLAFITLIFPLYISVAFSVLAAIGCITIIISSFRRLLTPPDDN